MQEPMEQGMEHNLLKHNLKREGLIRMEEAARTEHDFQRVVMRWDEIYKERLKKESKKEALLSSDMFDWSDFDNESRMRDEDDLFTWMFCCICKMHELMDDPDVYRLLNKATDKQKAVFFPRIVKNCTTQNIAQCYGMTDRNVRKLIDLMIDNIRHGLYEALTERHKNNPQKATLRELRFLATYEYVPKVKKSKKDKSDNNDSDDNDTSNDDNINNKQNDKSDKKSDGKKKRQKKVKT